MFASPRLALGFGIFLAWAETARRWGNWPFLPLLLDDWIAGIFLIYGAVPKSSRLGYRAALSGGRVGVYVGPDVWQLLQPPRALVATTGSRLDSPRRARRSHRHSLRFGALG